MAIRLVLTAAIMLLAVVKSSTPGPASGWQADRQLVVRASHALTREAEARVIRWLRTQPRVTGIILGSDHRTLLLRLRDGLNVALVPPNAGGGPARQRLHSLVRIAAAETPAGRRALVLEPFATEMGLGPDAGQVIAEDLRAAGFQVDLLTNEQVTLDEMLQLPRYDVVYTQTHIGVNQVGEGVVLTGQPFDGDPTLQPLIDNRSIMAGAVWGTDQMYYGIMSRYVHDRLAQFPAGSILVFNGCGLLNATRFWAALQSKGAGVMVSWDGDSLTADNTEDGDLLMDDLYRGMSVSQAVEDLRVTGHGVSYPLGMAPADLGFTGDGSLTLAGPPLTPTAVPTATAFPTVAPTIAPKPTRTPVVRATATKHRSGRHKKRQKKP